MIWTPGNRKGEILELPVSLAATWMVSFSMKLSSRILWSGLP